jgi:hypothetical protein
MCVSTKGQQWALLKMTAVTHEPKDKCIFSNQVMTICKLSKHAKIRMFSTDVEIKREFSTCDAFPWELTYLNVFGVSAFTDSISQQMLGIC